jgi:zinc transporter ZupT
MIVITAIFSSATPLGCLTGSAIVSSSAASAFVGPFAVGSLLYVTVFDLIYPAFKDSRNSLWPPACLTVGAATACLIMITTMR